MIVNTNLYKFMMNHVNNKCFVGPELTDATQHERAWVFGLTGYAWEERNRSAKLISKIVFLLGCPRSVLPLSGWNMWSSTTTTTRWSNCRRMAAFMFPLWSAVCERVSVLQHGQQCLHNALLSTVNWACWWWTNVESTCCTFNLPSMSTPCLSACVFVYIEYNE
jgi:hypothetical protein